MISHGACHVKDVRKQFFVGSSTHIMEMNQVVYWRKDSERAK